jgi:hypothetical protein
MKSEKPYRIEPIIKIKDRYYKVCSLNVKLKEKEFIYHFAYPRILKTRLVNINNNKLMGRPDHITFHKDGTVHISLKKDNRKLGENVMTDKTFLPDDKKIITPLLVHSIYPTSDGEYFLPILDPLTINPIIHKQNNWPSKSPFSVIICLTPDTISVGKVACKLGLGELFCSHAGRIFAWDGWAIDYLLTDSTLNLVTNDQDCLHHAFAFVDLHKIFRNMLFQRLASQGQNQLRKTQAKS